MKVVFVSSGNKAVGGISPFVQAQFDSLQNEGLEMMLFPVVGHGAKAYLKATRELRHLVKEQKPDIVHAHYSVCGYVASMATAFTKTKVLVSILGSFPRESAKLHIVRFFIRHIWDKTLVKSQRTANQLGMDLPVVPNGVNLEQFTLVDKESARKMVGFEDDKKYIIWCSNPSRPEKNYALAEQAVALLNDENVVLFPVYNRTHDEVAQFMCAADMLLLTSKNEGSPNVIKEAMACNCPIVTTDVGDVRERLENLEGCYVLDAEPNYNDFTFETKQLSACLRKALDFEGRTKGRERIIQDGLTTEQIAEKLIQLYGILCSN